MNSNPHTEKSLWNSKVDNSDLTESIKMQIRYKYLRRASLISYQSGNYIDRAKISGRNFDELNECSLAGRSGEQEK